MTSERCTGQCWWPWRKKSLKTEWLRHRLWIVQFSHHWKLLRLPSFLLLLHLSRTSMEVRLWRRRPSPSRRTSIGENVKSMMQGEMDKAPSIPLRYIMQHIWNANFIFHENNPLSWQEQEKKRRLRSWAFRAVIFFLLRIESIWLLRTFRNGGDEMSLQLLKSLFLVECMQKNWWR